MPLVTMIYYYLQFLFNVPTFCDNDGINANSKAMIESGQSHMG